MTSLKAPCSAESWIAVMTSTMCAGEFAAGLVRAVGAERLPVREIVVSRKRCCQPLPRNVSGPAASPAKPVGPQPERDDEHRRRASGGEGIGRCYGEQAAQGR
ncbi:hypothetical protein Pflav_013750 [Phytohabitans flavus]|uniref:Uncharacterized protein n=1 Tax=Phytohabitans flavus TaxID=1076124 RepID=A0A6F8XMC7_9ACTN|nr:hypothetical protein Pflav_013750 [Phytohabitans flavus]